MKISRAPLTSFWKSLFAQLLVIALLAISLPILSGCAQFSGAAAHGWEGDEYENTYLSTSSPLGRKALTNWQNYDIDVRQFLREYREPDVIYSKFSEVFFFYLEEKVQVHFDRGATGFKTAIEQTAIRDDLYDFLLQRFQ